MKTPVLIDGFNKKLGEFLREEIKNDAIISIITTYFSIYAYEALKMQLDKARRVRLLFSEPNFIGAEAPVIKREYYIPKINFENVVAGSPFEIQLKNTLTQKSLSRACAGWRKSMTRTPRNLSIS